MVTSNACGKIGHIDRISQNDITLVNVANKLNEIIDKINAANVTN